MGIQGEGGEGETMSSTEHPRCHWPCLAAACHATSGATCQKFELLDMFAIIPAISCPVYMSAYLPVCLHSVYTSSFCRHVEAIKEHCVSGRYVGAIVSMREALLIHIC